MRLTITTLLIWTLAIFGRCHDSLVAVDEPPASQKPAGQTEAPARKIQSSDKAVVKDVVYGLEEDGNRLYLTSQPLDGTDRELKRVSLNFVLPKGSEVVEMSLAKLDGKNLMAVIKVQRGEEYDFHCLTFIAPWGGHVRDRHGFHKAKFFTTRDDLKILAVGGKHYAGSVFIVLGNTGTGDKDEQVKEGVFYFSLCPWPPSDGSLSPFRVQSVPPKAATE